MMKSIKIALKWVRDTTVSVVKGIANTINTIFRGIERGLNWVGDIIPGLKGLGTVSKLVGAGLVIGGGLQAAFDTSAYLAPYGYLVTTLGVMAGGFIGMLGYPLAYLVYPPSLLMFLVDTVVLTLLWNGLKAFDAWLGETVNTQPQAT